MTIGNPQKYSEPYLNMYTENCKYIIGSYLCRTRTTTQESLNAYVDYLARGTLQGNKFMLFFILST